MDITKNNQFLLSVLYEIRFKSDVPVIDKQSVVVAGPQPLAWSLGLLDLQINGQTLTGGRAEADKVGKRSLLG